MIKSSCETCGDFRAAPSSVTSWVDEWGAPLWAVLNCPRCNSVIVRPGNDALASILEALGSAQRVMTEPVERVDETTLTAEPFTLFDLNEFRQLLESDEALLRELGH